MFDYKNDYQNLENEDTVYTDDDQDDNDNSELFAQSLADQFMVSPID